MGRFRASVAGSVLVVVAVAALVGPAGAADTQGTLAIVNGIPGKRVDVCLNGREIKSDLAYGRVVLRDIVPVGGKSLRSYARDRRTCRGTIVAQKSFTLDPGADLTIVATKTFPRVVTFDNKVPTFLGEIPPSGAPATHAKIAWRHASDVPADFKFRVWNPNAEQPVDPLDPAAIWTKGDAFTENANAELVVQVRATLPGDSETIASKRAFLPASHRVEWLLVGTDIGNIRFVLIDRTFSLASP